MFRIDSILHLFSEPFTLGVFCNWGNYRLLQCRVLWWAAVLWNWTETASPSQQCRAHRTGTVFQWPLAQTELRSGGRGKSWHITYPVTWTITFHKARPLWRGWHHNCTRTGKTRTRIPEGEKHLHCSSFCCRLGDYFSFLTQILCWFIIHFCREIQLSPRCLFSPLFVIPGWQLKQSNISI